MLSGADLVAFVATTDVTRARAFYEGTLGLRVIDEDPYALALDANGTMLRVTVVPELRPAGYTVCGWRVDDIAYGAGFQFGNTGKLTDTLKTVLREAP